MSLLIHCLKGAGRVLATDSGVVVFCLIVVFLYL